LIIPLVFATSILVGGFLMNVRPGKVVWDGWGDRLAMTIGVVFGTVFMVALNVMLWRKSNLMVLGVSLPWWIIIGTGTLVLAVGLWAHWFAIKYDVLTKEGLAGIYKKEKNDKKVAARESRQIN